MRSGAPTSLLALGQRIRDSLTERGLDWKAVAAQAGVDESWLYRLGRPKLTVRLDTVEAVAMALGIHPANLLYPELPTPEGPQRG